MPIDWKRIAGTARLGGGSELKNASANMNTAFDSLLKIPEAYGQADALNAQNQSKANTGAYLSQIMAAQDKEAVNNITKNAVGMLDTNVLAAGAADRFKTFDNIEQQQLSRENALDIANGRNETSILNTNAGIAGYNDRLTKQIASNEKIAANKLTNALKMTKAKGSGSSSQKYAFNTATRQYELVPDSTTVGQKSKEMESTAKRKEYIKNISKFTGKTEKELSARNNNELSTMNDLVMEEVKTKKKVKQSQPLYRINTAHEKPMDVFKDMIPEGVSPYDFNKVFNDITKIFNEKTKQSINYSALANGIAQGMNDVSFSADKGGPLDWLGFDTQAEEFFDNIPNTNTMKNSYKPGKSEQDKKVILDWMRSIGAAQ